MGVSLDNEEIQIWKHDIANHKHHNTILIRLHMQYNDIYDAKARMGQENQVHALDVDDLAPAGSVGWDADAVSPL